MILRLLGKVAEHNIGRARFSTQDQDPALQLDALDAAGCERIFQKKASGAQRDRPQLMAALDYLRAGDTLVVWKLRDEGGWSSVAMVERYAKLAPPDLRERLLTHGWTMEQASNTLCQPCASDLTRS